MIDNLFRPLHLLVFIIIFGIPLLCAYLAANEAKNKGRNGLGWGCLSFIFPPLVVIVFLATPIERIKK